MGRKKANDIPSVLDKTLRKEAYLDESGWYSNYSIPAVSIDTSSNMEQKKMNEMNLAKTRNWGQNTMIDSPFVSTK